MRTIKNTCILLLLVGASSAFPQYPGQGGVDGGLQQQQGGQVPVTSQCPSHQGCVPYFQCVDGYINTDGSGLLDLRLRPTGTCTEPDYPDVPAICCNIPGAPEPPPFVEVCPFQSQCVPESQCIGTILDTAGTMVPYATGGSWSTCGNSNIPGVCCAPPPPPFVEVCPFQSQCVPESQCIGTILDNSGTMVPYATGGSWSTCGDSNIPGVCCAPPPTPAPLTTCPGGQVCVGHGYCDAAGNVITDGSGKIDIRGGLFQSCYVDQSSEVGICCTPPAPPVTPGYPPAGQCGVRNAEPVIDQRIQSNVAYNEAQFGEFPWQGIIFFSNFTFKCGASLIGDRWLVTAAHCVNGFNPYDFKVRLGEWQVNTFDEPKPYIDVDVAAVTIHPQFNPKNVHNDIAVMQLVEPVPFQYHINSICLPSLGQTFWGQRCIATGWGKDAFEGQYQHIMKKVELPTVEHHVCQTLLRKTRLGKFFQLDDSFMCAGGEENKDACKGDGGGPLACQDPVTGRYVLTGITAFGVGCGNKDVPGVYADVQVLLPFVQAVVAGTYDPNSFNQQQQQPIGSVSGYGK